MAYQFPADVDQLVRQQMTVGGYTSEDDLLRDALSALSGRREVFEDIEQGIRDLEAGCGRPLDEIDAELRMKYGIRDNG